MPLQYTTKCRGRTSQPSAMRSVTIDCTAWKLPLRAACSSLATVASGTAPATSSSVAGATQAPFSRTWERHIENLLQDMLFIWWKEL